MASEDTTNGEPGGGQQRPFYQSAWFWLFAIAVVAVVVVAFFNPGRHGGSPVDPGSYQIENDPNQPPVGDPNEPNELPEQTPGDDETGEGGIPTGETTVTESPVPENEP
ncbi:hypothetical protein [Corynebacterium otitidis]|uniref:Uncharacterized protein n=1 Tax=Corynebacterium otitidis ATCC 51513 TaxID=883169 RepID=I7L8H7_9CORY|nr:hypothetical protein [Corynebacterium otitidis]EJZ81995.1 hypothetical protein HMPREF9719_01067 [Corynebacterium otitidis ATCC 51513]CCI83232.1 hypothetical protein BN46_0492 [Corynebacterium otitidis ATCC 51513]